MEMLFLTAPPSLLWPDGIRERSEAVKANTSKKRKRKRGDQEDRGEGLGVGGVVGVRKRRGER